MTGWLRHHLTSLVEAGVRLALSPFAAAINIIVIGTVLALPIGGWMLLSGLQGFVAGISTEPEISVFMSMQATRADAAEVEKKLRGISVVRTVRFVGRKQALEALARSPGVTDIVATLKENPLPDTVVATLSSAEPESASRVAAEVRAMPRVADVQADAEWMRRANAALGFGRTLIAVLALVIALALVAVTFNTIRLQVLTRRDEIVLSRLIGATDSYIRRPFFYFGAMQAALAGLVALAIVHAAAFLLDRDLEALHGFLGASPRLTPPGAADALAILVFAAVIGVCGSYLSVSRHLHDIE